MKPRNEREWRLVFLGAQVAFAGTAPFLRPDWFPEFTILWLLLAWWNVDRMRATPA